MPRTITHTKSGATALELTLSAGEVRVVADRSVRKATVTLKPQRAGDDEAERCIEAANVSSSGSKFRVAVPSQQGGRGGGIVQVNGNVVISGGSGTVVQSGGVTTIVGSSGVLAEVRVPEMSSVNIDAQSAGVSTRGRLAEVTAETGSGHVSVETGDQVRVNTGSGDIEVERSDDVDLRAGSGDVEIATASGRVQVRTGSGNVRATFAESAADPRIKTGSGNVRISGAQVDTSGVRTGSGSVRVR